MANLEKFKEKARKFEAKEQWAKAIEEYVKAIDTMEASSEIPDAELTLYNRVGDLYQKIGQSQHAVAYYERAADKYHEIGLSNNAIALCNKALRIAPGRSQVYLKLGMMFAAKGFAAEAKTNLLEYADRMQKAGQLEEAFKALKKFAEMTPGQDEIWSVLAQQARGAARTREQKEQVEKLLAEFEAKERASQHRKTRASRHMITGEELPEERPAKKGDLIFLELEPTPRRPPSATPPKPAAPEAELPPLEIETPLEIEPTALEIEPTALVSEEEPQPAEAAPELEIESTSLAGDEAALELEPTSLAEPEPGAADLELEAAPEPVAEVAPGEDEGVAAPVAEIELPPFVEVGEPAVEAPEAAAEAAGAPAEAGEAPPEGRAAEEEAVAGTQLEFLDIGEVVAPPSVEELEARLAADPQDWEAHRLLGEALIEQGERERGLGSLDAALEGLEQADELDAAYGIAEELLRLEPNSVRHHQKRVELAYRQGDRQRLAAAYLELADALLRSGEAEKALAVYERVLEHDPANARAKSAVETLAPPPAPAPVGRRATPPQAPKAPEPAGVGAGSGFVDLGTLLLEEETPKDTRMRIQDEEPSGDEEQDFQTMLTAFKRGVEANVEEEDFQSHYDLGIAYKEMGLLDEAIAEFQKALRSPDGRLKASEALGLCFFEKGQFTVADTIFRRALDLPASGDAERIGLLYWLGRTQEELGRGPDGLIFYSRVFAVDITFQDVSQRVQSLSRAGA
jgi:tetratricopeptide (TPR) repeat protein